MFSSCNGALAEDGEDLRHGVCSLCRGLRGLYPLSLHLRNFVVQAAVDRLVESRWTDDDEWIRNLAANVPAIPVERPKNTCQLMNDALPSATVVGYENHIEAMRLPDPNDRHVLAAGIAAGATVILTWNLRHFPAKELKRFGFRRATADVPTSTTTTPSF
jgi:hypothetical protein